MGSAFFFSKCDFFYNAKKIALFYYVIPTRINSKFPNWTSLVWKSARMGEGIVFFRAGGPFRIARGKGPRIIITETTCCSINNLIIIIFTETTVARVIYLRRGDKGASARKMLDGSARLGKFGVGRTALHSRYKWVKKNSFSFFETLRIRLITISAHFIQQKVLIKAYKNCREKHLKCILKTI